MMLVNYPFCHRPLRGGEKGERKEGREGQSMKESYCNGIVGGCR